MAPNNGQQESTLTVAEQIAQKQQAAAVGKAEPADVARTQMSDLSPEERKKAYAALRLRMSKSKLEVIAPPGLSPYWARKGDDTELARLDYLGFRIVKELDRSKLRFKAQGLKEDGTYVMGDVILMCIPTDEYEFYLSENADRSSQMSSAAKAKFIEDAERQGAPTFVVKRGK